MLFSMVLFPGLYGPLWLFSEDAGTWRINRLGLVDLAALNPTYGVANSSVESGFANPVRACTGEPCANTECTTQEDTILVPM